MRKEDREIRQLNLSEEALLLKALYERYETASEELARMTRELMLDIDDPRVVYQIEYQNKLVEQIQEILGKMNADNVADIESFLLACAELGCLAALYSLAAQGMKTIAPLDYAVYSDAAKIVAGHTGNLATKVRGEISRGIAKGLTAEKIYGIIEPMVKADYNKVAQVARTEGGRVFEQNNFAGMLAAQSSESAVMKEWSSVMDVHVRKDHQILHGQRVPLNEPFVLHSVDGNIYEAMYPHGFGVPKEDINCRCSSIPIFNLDGHPPQEGDPTYDYYTSYYKKLLAAVTIAGAAAIDKTRQEKS